MQVQMKGPPSQACLEHTFWPINLSQSPHGRLCLSVPLQTADNHENLGSILQHITYC